MPDLRRERLSLGRDKMITLSKEFFQGQDAYQHGLFLRANPWVWGSSADPCGERNTAWNDGWLSVREVKVVIERSLDKRALGGQS